MVKKSITGTHEKSLSKHQFSTKSDEILLLKCYDKKVKMLLIGFTQW